MTFKSFDLLDDLRTGTHLLEASAGTGKTYTIAALVLRLVAEHNIPLEEILVVTFTRAATAELRDRIRARLSEALTALEQDSPAQGDEIQCHIYKLMCADETRRTRVLLNLNLATQQLESAGIFTIHSFCNRVLGQAAFEAGISLNPELIKSIDKIAVDCAGDLYNLLYHDRPEDQFDYLWNVCKLDYEGLCELAKVTAHD